MDEDESDYCYECEGYGDDYSVDEHGELVCNTYWHLALSARRRDCS